MGGEYTDHGKQNFRIEGLNADEANQASTQKLVKKISQMRRVQIHLL